MVGYFLPIALNTKLEHASTWVWKQWNKSFSEYFLQQYWSWSRVSANEMFCRGPVCYPNGLKFVWTIGLCIKLYNRPGNDVLHEDISFCALRNILMWQNTFFRQLFELQCFDLNISVFCQRPVCDPVNFKTAGKSSFCIKLYRGTGYDG